MKPEMKYVLAQVFNEFGKIFAFIGWVFFGVLVILRLNCGAIFVTSEPHIIEAMTSVFDSTELNGNGFRLSLMANQ
jgi:hypothetical protein